MQHPSLMGTSKPSFLYSQLLQTRLELLSKTFLTSSIDRSMAFSNSFPLLPLSLLLLLLLTSLSKSSIHDLLQSRGLPPGLLPKQIKSYTLSESGLLEVYLDEPCLAKIENRLYFETVVRANLSYGGLTGVAGLSQEELFLWLPVKDIIVDDPNSGLILFDIGLARKQFSVSLFEEPPDCKPPQGGLVRRDMRKPIRGFGDQR